LQAGEIDGLQTVSSDFLPVLAADPSLQIVKSTVATYSDHALQRTLPAVRQSGDSSPILSVIDQTEFMTALMGTDNKSYWQSGRRRV